MKRILQISLFAMITIVSSGCAGISKFAYHSMDTSPEWRNCNYRIVKTVAGQATATYVFGIGGMSERANKLFDESYKKMVQSANLDNNQMIVNIVAERKFKTWLGIVCTHTIYTTGTVIEFIESKKAPIESQRVTEYTTWNGVECIVVSTKSDGTPALLISKEEAFVNWADEFLKLDDTIEIGHAKDGRHNLNVIKTKVQKWSEKYPAFGWCANFGEGWYLPSKEEMELVVKSGVLGKIQEPYLTSTEADKDNCYAIGANATQHFSKYNRANVRAIFRVE